MDAKIVLTLPFSDVKAWELGCTDDDKQSIIVLEDTANSLNIWSIEHMGDMKHKVSSKDAITGIVRTLGVSKDKIIVAREGDTSLWMI